MNQPAIILVVDDVAANRETLRELLDAPDYRVVESVDGSTALRLAAETPPDLVLLDVMKNHQDIVAPRYGFDSAGPGRTRPWFKIPANSS